MRIIIRRYIKKPLLAVLVVCSIGFTAYPGWASTNDRSNVPKVFGYQYGSEFVNVRSEYSAREGSLLQRQEQISKRLDNLEKRYSVLKSGAAEVTALGRELNTKFKLFVPFIETYVYIPDNYVSMIRELSIKNDRTIDRTSELIWKYDLDYWEIDLNYAQEEADKYEKQLEALETEISGKKYALALKGKMEEEKLAKKDDKAMASGINDTPQGSATSTVKEKNLQESKINIYIHGNLLNSVAEPVIENGIVMVPLRSIYEGLGINVAWDGATSTITCTGEKYKVKLALGKKEATRNGETIVLDVAPKLINEVTFVPLKFIKESTGENVAWENDSRSVHIVAQRTNK